MSRRSLLLTSLLILTACGGGPSSGADAGMDAATIDAATMDDAGTDDASSRDAATVDDAARDAGAEDAGPPDSGVEPCVEPGASEAVSCGRCGTTTRFCTADGVWVYDPCEGEGECAPGTMRTEACGNCGDRTDRCTTACEWMPGECTGEGPCAPGATMVTSDGCPADQLRELTCSATCAFEESMACSAERCMTPGDIETLPCGMCGERERFCTASMAWDYGVCMNEGVCMPGTTGAVPCGRCGMRPANCNVDCALVPSGACTGEGVCTPGERVRTSDGCPSGQRRLLECDSACGFSIEIEPCESSIPVDVLFLTDATGSNWSEFESQRATFLSRCVDPLLAIPDVFVGLAYYGDFGSSVTFEGAVELGPSTSAAISTSILIYPSLGGADDSTMEALTILTGGTAQPGGTPFVCSAGRVAGGCWRPGAQRVIALHTDEYARGGPDSADATLYNPWPTGPNWSTVEPRLTADGTLLFTMLDDGFATTGDPLGMYTEMVMDLGQPATDVVVEAPTIADPCDALVARVRTIAGL